MEAGNIRETDELSHIVAEFQSPEHRHHPETFESPPEMSIIYPEEEVLSPSLSLSSHTNNRGVFLYY